MYHIFLAIVSIAICYKLGDWRNWRKYYSTILFFILSSVVCIVLTYNHPLWLYKSEILNQTFSDLLISITVYPSTIMLFIPHLPNGKIKTIRHISYYVAVYSIVEFIASKLGYFSYYNGWNIGYTIIFNYIMFPILILHYRKPVYVWFIVLICPHILFFLLKIPYSTIR